METTYWQKQSSTKPLFRDIEWSKPEQRNRAGKLAVIGGNKLSFVAAAQAYETALQTGAGQCRVVLPDALKKSIPPVITDTVFVPTNQSGGMEKSSTPQLLAAGDWADCILLIGDAGRNSETAIVYEELLQKNKGPVVITRDAIDLLINSSHTLAERPDTLLIASFAQLQKLFKALYYPKVITFSMQLTNFVDCLHKFTITYPLTVGVLHQGAMVVAGGGQVSTTPWEDPMSIWRGSVATKAACYWMWNRQKVFEAVTASLLS